MKIVVLMGGISPERDVSLATGREIARALRENGHEVVVLDPADGRLDDLPPPPAEVARVGRSPPEAGQLAQLAALEPTRVLGELTKPRETDAIFVALHGGAGEDGRIQALLDVFGVPYTGSGCLGSALAMDKLVSKQLFSQTGIPTPAWLMGPAEPSRIESEMGGFPVVVKPTREGSTVGVTVVRSADELESAFERASAFEGPPMIERFISGSDLAVGILGDEPLPVVEIRASHEIYDYECKYTHGMTEYLVPAPLSSETTAAVQSLALTAHRTLRLAAYSRVDFRLDDDGKPWCLEANSLPGMTPTSLLPKAAAASGTSFSGLCERIVQLALRRGDGNGSRPASR